METNDWTTGTVKLSLYGEPVEMQMTVPAKPVKPTRMLPIFQMIANSFVEVGVNAAESRGEKISCQKGCGACCRQPVPLAEIEAYEIAELVENLPEPRRSEIKKRFAEGVEYFHKIGWFERLENYAELSLEERQKLIMEYFYKGIPCPFLEDESCSIHMERPLSCREYLVTNPAVHCAAPTAETIKPVKLLFKLSEILRGIGYSENLTKSRINFVPLIRALEWAEMFPENFREKTGEVWIADFFQALAKMKNPPKEANAEDY